MLNQEDFKVLRSKGGIMLSSLSKRSSQDALEYLCVSVGLARPRSVKFYTDMFHFHSCVNSGSSIHIYSTGDIIVVYDKPTPYDKQKSKLKSLLIELLFAL